MGSLHLDNLGDPVLTNYDHVRAGGDKQCGHVGL